MSKAGPLDSLPDSTRSLVLNATKNSPAAFGNTEEDTTQISTWLQKANGRELTTRAGLKSLESHLLSRTYLVGNSLTAADIVVYATLHAIICKETPPEYYSHPALTRWFDHIQLLPNVRTAGTSTSPPFSLVSFDIENAPKQVRSSEAPKKKANKSVKVLATEPPATTPMAPSQEHSPKEKEKETKRQHKEPKEKKADTSAPDGTKRATNKSAAAESITPVPSMIDLRVGHIIDVQKHPDADGLYVEQIDIGEESGPRTVVSGLVNYIPIEQMRDKWLIAVCNLKPATMRGVKSYAMVLCATHKNGKEAGIEIVDPPSGSKPGDRVYFEGPYENDTPLEQLNPKRKIFETIQPGFTTLESREAAWLDPVTKTAHRLRTKNGYCTAPSFIEASLS